MMEDFVSFMAKLVESQNMKNPSLKDLQSLFQINQVRKEENQRRNLTSNNFATHLLALRNGQEECVLQDRGQTKLKEFRKSFFPLRKLWMWIAKGLRNSRNLRNHNWRKTISQPNFCLANFSQPCEISHV